MTNLRVDFTHVLSVDTSGGKIRSALINAAENDIVRNTILLHMGKFDNLKYRHCYKRKMYYIFTKKIS